MTRAAPLLVLTEVTIPAKLVADVFRPILATQRASGWMDRPARPDDGGEDEWN